MKNEQENSAQEEMQEQICAYLLQELDAKDAAHVEQRLAESAVWREERDRLSGTIGLVRSAMNGDVELAPEGEQLSEAVLQRLALVGTQAAAGHGKGSAGGAVKASPMRMFVPIAATIAVALGGYLAIQKSEMFSGVNSENTARVDGSAAVQLQSPNVFGGIPTEMDEEFITWRTGSAPGESAIDLNGFGLQEEPTSGEKRPIFNVKHTAGHLIVRKEPLYSPETHDGLKDPMVDVKKKLAIIAKNMPRKDDLPGDHLMIRGDRSVRFEYVQQVMQEAAQEGIQVYKTQLGVSLPNPAPSEQPPADSSVTYLEILPVGAAGSEGAVTLPGKRNGRGADQDESGVVDYLGDLTVMPTGGITTGGDDWLISKGEAEEAEVAEAPASKKRKSAPKSKEAAPANNPGGSYRGPGDAAPAGGGGGPITGGRSNSPSGSSTPGPSSPGPVSPTPVAKPGQPMVGLALREVKNINELADREVAETLAVSELTARITKTEKERLRSIGYVGSEGEFDYSLGAFGDEDLDPEIRARAKELYDSYAVYELKSQVVPDAELLLALSNETADEFRARTEQLNKASLERQAKDGKEVLGRPSIPQAVDRFQRDGVVLETSEQLELRLRTSIAERAAKRHQNLVRSCIPKPSERPNAMYYRWWGDNPFVYTSTDSQATFAADVDTASYTLARRYLTGGNLPTRDQVRTEEFVNYFAGDIPAPTEDVFAVQTEMTASPFGGSKNRYMLRVGVRGKVIPKDQRPAMALVFVVDTSGSMSNGNRMDLVKHSLRLLGTELDGRDQVGVVSFASEARLVLPMTSMDERGELESALQSLSPHGSTNVEDGIRLGYELLSRVPADGRLRRVVLISDGVANTGSTVADEILKSVKMHRESGIYLSTVGVGMGNHNDALLERLANRGDGICDYVDDADAARRAMVERFSGGFIPIARDLKIQLEFENKSVLRYRQIGYENRAVADADFRNDAVDGGEVGSGHQVTALFELECVDLPDAGELSMNDLGKVRLRYKSVQTGSDQQVFETEHSMQVQAGPVSFDAGSPGFARSVVAAQFAEVLRRSTHASGDDYAMLLAQAMRVAGLPAFAGDGETSELAGMIRRAGQLGAGAPVHRDELWTTVNTYRRHRYLCGTEEEMGGKPTSERLTEIAAINAELEVRIRELSLREALQGR